MKSPNHLNALRAFETTARRGGYVAAADEIGVTPEAVGQLVRTLEGYLGVRLFDRGRAGRRLVPTQEALVVLPGLTDAFRTLAGAIERLKSLSASGVLTLTSVPSFTAKWLMPRLPTFLAAQPEIDIRLDITDRVVDLEAGDADVAIRYGQGNWPGVSSTTLFANENIFPACSPELLEKTPELLTPAGMSKQVLIRDTTITHPDYPSWRHWFRKFGLVGDESAPMIEFNAALMAIEAAILGQGVALVREHLVREELESRRLVRLFPDHELSTGWSYYVLTSKQPCHRALVFANWLASQAASSQS